MMSITKADVKRKLLKNNFVMEYKIVVSHSGEGLTKMVNQYIEEGWQILGSHQVQIRHQQYRYRGSQLIDILNDLEYTQTLIKENK